MAATKGKVQTVLGLVDPSSLGVTMMHEHMYYGFHEASLQPEGKYADKAHCDFTLESLGWIRQNPYRNKQNVMYCDEAVNATMRDELRAYRENGGGTIVEVTNYGSNRNARLLAEYSRDTGVTIVTGTDFERRAIQAAALGQQATGCPVNFHPGRHEHAPPEVLRIFQEAGGDVSNCIMSHMDRSILTAEGLEEFAKLGSYIEYDLFGIETSHYSLAPNIDMPSDAERIRCIGGLVEAGYEDRLVISHDIHTKHRLTKFGGHGFTHILENVVPMMKIRGFSDETINKILSTNPQAAMTFKK